MTKLEIILINFKNNGNIQKILKYFNNDNNVYHG